MKLFALISFFFYLVSFGFTSASTIDPELQSLMLHPEFSRVKKIVQKATLKVGTDHVTSFGEVRRETLLGDEYFYIIPTYAVKVPMNPESVVFLGNVVADMNAASYAPLPEVLGVYFAPAVKNHRKVWKKKAQQLVCKSRNTVDSGFEIIIELADYGEPSTLIHVRELRNYQTDHETLEVLVHDYPDYRTYTGNGFELKILFDPNRPTRMNIAQLTGILYGKTVQESLLCFF